MIIPANEEAREPREHPPVLTDLPLQKYELEYAYGYRCTDARQNL